MSEQEHRSDEAQGHDTDRSSRRRFIKTAAYVAPILVTLAAAPALAQSGSAAPINCPPGEFPFFIPGTGWTCVT